MHWANGKENSGIVLFEVFKLLYISFSLNAERSVHDLTSIWFIDTSQLTNPYTVKSLYYLGYKILLQFKNRWLYHPGLQDQN